MVGCHVEITLNISTDVLALPYVICTEDSGYQRSISAIVAKRGAMQIEGRCIHKNERYMYIYRNSTAFAQKKYIHQCTKESLQRAKYRSWTALRLQKIQAGGKHMALADPDLLCLYSAVPSSYLWLPLERE